MIFRQLFDSASSTYTYLIGCAETGRAILIDPVLETLERDRATLDTLDLKLAWTVETHVHADHVSAGAALRSATGCKIAAPAGEAVDGADLNLTEGEPVTCGSLHLKPLATPGHTSGHLSYLLERGPLPMVFTGDTLLIDGCGRTDFQSGDAGAMYDAVHSRLFTLPDATRVFPGHDYRGNSVSTIGHERRHNARLANCDRDAFIARMAKLELPPPKLIDVAVSANRRLGIRHGG